MRIMTLARAVPETPGDILITDVGSTTTKALLISRRESDQYRLEGTAEAPTTVEWPYEDVMVGVRNAIGELEKQTNRRFLEPDALGLIPPGAGGAGIYLSTSSAGGGLQVLVCGVMKKVTAESAARAALGAGAVLLDTICVDDDRPMFQRMDLVRGLRPDMILVSGGIDGGNAQFALEIADMLNAANPQPRFGKTYKIPLIFAGNKDAGPMVLDTAKDGFDVKIVPNLRPTLSSENLLPARNEIHELFMSHVMAQAPGYRQLLSWVSAPVLPTPAAAGRMIELLSKGGARNVVGMDIGGATTDIFSVFGGDFQRSVSANLGMSYSAANVLVTAGVENVKRWLPFECDAGQVTDEVATKMIFPTTLPQDPADLAIEQSVAREALRLAYEQHKQVAGGPPRAVGALERLTMSTDQVMKAEMGLEQKPWHKIDLLVGSGGVISHAPDRRQAALMMLDAFAPEGVVELVVDSVFMLPHLGVLSITLPDVAMQVLETDCLIRLGTAICLTGTPVAGAGAVTVSGRSSAGRQVNVSVNWGEIKIVPLAPGERFDGRVTPSAHADGGRGSGRPYDLQAAGGSAGLIIDARGRPVDFSLWRAARAAGWSEC
jgi:uncharacterized protein (TIGR01319 family)